MCTCGRTVSEKLFQAVGCTKNVQPWESHRLQGNDRLGLGDLLLHWNLGIQCFGQLGNWLLRDCVRKSQGRCNVHSIALSPLCGPVLRAIRFESIYMVALVTYNQSCFTCVGDSSNRAMRPQWRMLPKHLSQPGRLIRYFQSSCLGYFVIRISSRSVNAILEGEEKNVLDLLDAGHSSVHL